MMEFQAIVMAAGTGSRIMEVTSSIPKCLLPICNIPVIISCLRMVKSAKVNSIIILVNEAEKVEVMEAIEDQCDPKIEVISIPKNEDWGTADSLRFIKGKIVRDVVVVSSDLVTNFDLRKMANIHREHNSSLTMLLTPWPKAIKDAVIPGHKGKHKQEKDIVGMDGSGRLMFFNSEADFENGVPMKLSILSQHPIVQVYSNLMDSHVYMMKKSLVDFIGNNKNISTLKGEFLPVVVSKQFQKNQDVLASKIIDKAANGYQPSDANLNDLAMQLPSGDSRSGAGEENHCRDELKCFAYIDDDAFCMRANTLVAYAEINRQVPKFLETVMGIEKKPLPYAKSQVDAESMLGPDCELLEKSSIKHSVIGRHCQLGEKVKISNSILMNNVIVASGSSIHNSIVCNNVQVGSNSELKNCIIGPDQKVNDTSKLSNEVLQGSYQLMEI